MDVKNYVDVGTKFDIRAEVLKNGTVVASGQVNCVSLGFNSVTFNEDKAVLKAIDLAAHALPANFASGDTLNLQGLRANRPERVHAFEGHGHPVVQRFAYAPRTTATSTRKWMGRA